MNLLTKILLIFLVLVIVFFLMNAIQESTSYSNAGQTFNFLILIVVAFIVRAIYIAKPTENNHRRRRRF
jgi:positive regulator of sigma E activity